MSATAAQGPFLSEPRAFGIKRALVAVNTELPPDNLLAQTFNGGYNRRLGISIISPRLALQMARYCGLPLAEFQQKLNQAISSFPESLAGELGAVALFGHKSDQTGRRHVAYHIGNGTLRRRLEVEKQAVIKELGVGGNQLSNDVFHLTIFSSFNQDKAERLAVQARETSPREIEIELGKAVLFPLLKPDSKPRLV